MGKYYCVACDAEITEKQAEKSRDGAGLIYCGACEDSFHA